MRLWALAALSLAGCRALLGNLDECATRSDCTGRGTGLTCVDGLCVTQQFPPLDPACERLGGGSEKPFRVGSILGRTLSDGGVNLTGIARQDALLLAVEQLAPPTRGLKGQAIELFACDSHSLPTEAARLAAHLIRQEVATVFTGGSSETQAAASETIRSDTLLISVSATSPEISDIPDRSPDAGPADPGLVWRTAAPDTLQGAVLVGQFADAGTPKVAVLALNDSYGQGLYAAFSRDYPMDRRQAFFYPRGADVTATAAQAAAYGPAALLVIAFPDDAARLLQAFARHRPLSGVMLAFTDSARSPALLSAGVPLEGAVGTAAAPANLSSPAFQWFDGQYRQRFGRDARAVSSTTNAFDALMCSALAAHQAWTPGEPVSGTAMARVLGQLTTKGATLVPLDPPHFNAATTALSGSGVDIEGASGPLDFDAEKGEAPGAIELWRISDGGFVTIGVINP